ncbi:hypothetical protein [Pseudomonas sp. PS01302]|uniref:hypothetical protein n=1 Tax=Pseudomonas sp. PS01302 TaxID=2991438 RepID=UPI00249AAC52|nr:hypothetical protein [Pseudomonas sp. PS01302]
MSQAMLKKMMDVLWVNFEIKTNLKYVVVHLICDAMALARALFIIQTATYP